MGPILRMIRHTRRRAFGALGTLRSVEGSVQEPSSADASVKFLSSRCVVERMGPGRYGDPLDPNGSERAIAELKRVVAPGGDRYLSVPLDDESRVYFCAHRAFGEADLLAPFEVLERRYIYRGRFLEEPETGFGVGSYHLHRPA